MAKERIDIDKKRQEMEEAGWIAQGEVPGVYIPGPGIKKVSKWKTAKIQLDQFDARLDARFSEINWKVMVTNEAHQELQQLPQNVQQKFAALVGSLVRSEALGHTSLTARQGMINLMEGQLESDGSDDFRVFYAPLRNYHELVVVGFLKKQGFKGGTSHSGYSTVHSTGYTTSAPKDYLSTEGYSKGTSRPQGISTNYGSPKRYGSSKSYGSSKHFTSSANVGSSSLQVHQITFVRRLAEYISMRHTESSDT